MTVVIIRRRRGLRETHRKEGLEKMEAKFGVMQFKPRNARDCQESLDSRKK